MNQANSNHLGLIEQVPSDIDLRLVVELLIQGATQENKTHLDLSNRYILYLKIDTQDAKIDNQTENIVANRITKVQDTLIIDVLINGKTFTLQCDKIKLGKHSKYIITSEIEEEAESLIKANKPNSGINDLFVSIHGHGRLWEISDAVTETWEVLLLDKINYFRISRDPDIARFMLAPAFGRLAILHDRHFVYGRPTLDHLAFKADNGPGAQFHPEKMMWIKGLAIKEISSFQTLTKNLLKMKDITSLLLDNTRVLTQLDVERIEDLELSIFKFYPHKINTGVTVFPTIIMPHEILNADINDFNSSQIANPVLYTPEFWLQDRRTEIQNLLEDLSENSRLHTIIENLVSFYKRYKPNPKSLPIPATDPPSQPIPPVPSTPTPPPPHPTPVPMPIPSPSIPLIRHLPALIGSIYFITINQQSVSPFGKTSYYYKYRFITNNQIIIGTGDSNPQSFLGDPNTYTFTFTTDKVMITPNGAHYPVTFNFQSGIPYVMQVMWGGVTKRLDMRFVPPVEI